MTFDAAVRIADAVLYEGYVLYPYRASAAKNQFRWQFGVLAPRAPRDDGEPWFARTECVVRPGGCVSSLTMRARFLQPRPASAADGTPRSWLQGSPHDVELGPIPLEPGRERTWPLLAGDADVRLTLRSDTREGFITLQVRLENHEPWRSAFDTSRDAMLARSVVGAHVLLAVDEGTFVSLLDPPPDASALSAACVNRHAWPVLLGDPECPQMMLASPIVLYDFPAIAPESPADLCDGAEIDEILSLRILTLTDNEKREARETDPRARQIVDRVDTLGPDDWTSLHGTLRGADFFNPPGTPSPDEASVIVAGRRVARGSRVRLHPTRRADTMDLFLADQPATVAGVYQDVDDRVHVAVTVDADPGAALHESFGRYFYFDPAEVEPLPEEESA